METSYRTRVPSPFQVMKRPAYKRPEPTDTVRDELNKLLGTYQFSATFEEDTQTTGTLKDITGRVVAFLCTLKKDGKVIGQGRGATAINQINKFIVRNISFAFHASFIDAVVRSTKLQDVFRPDAVKHSWNGPSADTSESYESGESITDKQKSYLLQLIQTNVNDEDERENLVAQIDEYTKEEASQAIKRFAN